MRAGHEGQRMMILEAMASAPGPAVLDLYDGTPHIFQFRPQMVDAPESKKAALKKMTSFLRQHLGG
jgi:hypothetical protein